MRHILAVMVRRVGAFLLALVVTGAPAALTACELGCAAHGGDSSHGDANAPLHSCHDTHSEGSTTSVSSRVHVCGHGDALPTAPGNPTLQTAPTPTVAAIVPTPHLDPERLLRRSQTISSSPSGHSKVTTPLRI